MNNKQSLISVSTLSYIWESKQMDNIDLLRPFIVYLLHEIYDYTQTPMINEKNIAEGLKNKFSFDEIPIGVVKKVLERLCKKTNFIERSHKKYYLTNNVSNENEQFLTKLNKSEGDINLFLTEFKTKLVNYGVLRESCSEIDVQNIIFDFLEKNGYILIKNIKTISKINIKDNKVQLTISRIIIEESDKNSKFFEKFLKVVEGYMLSNVIYLQIDNNNNSTLKNLIVYLDSPLILEALGFKSESANKMTSEMLELLKKQGANIGCFSHNVKEVYGFLENYKKSIHKKRDLSFKTIELFDEENYSEEEIDNVILHLKNLIQSKGIKIQDTPCLNTETHKENYDYVIGYTEFKDYIKQNYSHNNRNSDIFIENDIDSINSIAIIRKNIKYNNIDKCKAIFVTKNYDLVYLTNKYLDYKPYEEIGLIINDVDLITLLWQKSYNINKDLPRVKMLSNALAGYEPSPQMLNKISSIVHKMEKAGINDDNAVISDILSSHTKKVDLMETTYGDPKNLNEEVLLNIISREKNKDINKLSKEIEKLKLEINTIKDCEEEKEKTERKNNRFLSEKISNKILNISEVIFKIILIVVFLLLVYCIIQDFLETKKFKFINFVLLVFTIIGYIFNFIAPFNYFNKITSKKQKKLENYIYNIILKIKSKLN